MHLWRAGGWGWLFRLLQWPDGATVSSLSVCMYLSLQGPKYTRCPCVCCCAQMLKFGQVIDLELLDKVSSSRGTEDLKEDMRRQEVAYARELAEWDTRIAARTDELVALTRENTACLNAVSELTSAQRGLEAGLTSKRKGLFTDPVQQRKAEVG